jgi:Na+/H+-dicarboxylate symporter
MKFSMPKRDLTFYIVVAIVLGILTGVVLNSFKDVWWIQSYLMGGLFELGGRIFLSTLKLLVVPMVFVSLVCGVLSLKEISQLKRMGLKTMVFYVGTTALAVAFAILFAVLFDPGEGFKLTSNATFEAKAAPSFVDVIAGIVPSNPIKAMVDAEMLQIIFLAILFGLALSLVKTKAQKITAIFFEANEIILKMVFMILWVAPIGVFCLLAKVFANEGFSTIVPLSKYFFTVLFVLFFHFLVVYGGLLKLFTKVPPKVFFQRIQKVLAFAFSTSSSNATLPVTLEEAELQLGVENEVAAFTLPLGATVNMDGTSIMQGVATVFIAQVYGVDLGIMGYLTVIVMATLASIGTAGVPGVGLVMLTMVFTQVGLPVEGIGLIIGVDRLLDMTRTCVNVTGDLVVTCIVAESEGKLHLPAKPTLSA